MRLTIEPTDDWLTEQGVSARLWRVVDDSPDPVILLVIGCAVPVGDRAPKYAAELIGLCKPPGDACN